MTWLDTHAYVAAWLSPALALFAMVIGTFRGTTTSTNWSKRMVYMGFLTGLAAVFTPVLDDSARMFAAAVVVPTLWFIIWDAVTNKP
jgi:hypothetical protein